MKGEEINYDKGEYLREQFIDNAAFDLINMQIEKQQLKFNKMENVNHPNHYKGKDNPYEVIKVIDAWELGFSLGNAIKYIGRANAKGKKIEDLQKAIWYIQHEIDGLLSNDKQ